MVRWITYSIHKTDSLEELNDKVIEELRLEKTMLPGPDLLEHVSATSLEVSLTVLRPTRGMS